MKLYIATQDASELTQVCIRARLQSCRPKHEIKRALAPAKTVQGLKPKCYRSFLAGLKPCPDTKQFATWLLLSFLFAVASSAAAIDREAFTISRYQLEVQVDRSAHVIAVTGKLTLRNDSNKPQKLATLQVSSSLAWNAIVLDDKPVQWLGDNYTSDIDHTGSLSEAIITLPREIPPAATVTLGVQYGGTITPDATRLTRMGAPAEVTTRNDWDQISDAFTAVRGLGYVTWYPVAIEAVSLSDGNAVFDAIARWKHRHDRSEFDAAFAIEAGEGKQPLRIATNMADSHQGNPTPELRDDKTSHQLFAKASVLGLGETVPTFAIADYVELARPAIMLFHLADHTSLARDYAVAAEANDPLLLDWLGDPTESARIIELTDPNANPWQNGPVLFTPLREAPAATLQLLLLPAQVAARFHSPHAWIQDGLERFLQTVAVERRSGRRAALEFLDQYREPLVQAEQAVHPKATKSSPNSNAASNTLLNTNDDLYLRGKGGFVFWMLRDMTGSEAMQRAISSYRGGADKDPSYFQHLVQTTAKRDLEWFFDDWVYRDRGLPEFHVESAYTRPLLNEAKSFLVTATIENRGTAGAEVPVLIQTPSGEKSARVLVKAGEKATGRIEMPIAPAKIVVNDGSVPEANLGNNVYEIPAKQP
jgi:hypothetical protein